MSVINLIPETIRRAEAQRLRMYRWGVAVGVAAVLAAVPYLLNLSGQAKAVELREELTVLDGEALSLRGQLRSATASTQELLSELERSKALRTKRAWSGIFALIAASLPQDSWVQLVSTEPDTPRMGSTQPVAPADAAASEKITIDAPRKIRIVGLSPSDAQPLVFVGNLRESNAFASVALQKVMRAGDTEEPGGEPMYQFEIVCEW